MIQGLLAALAVAIVGLILLHGDAQRAWATGDGDFTGTLTVDVGGTTYDCEVRGSLVGGSTQIAGDEAYQVTDTLVDTSVVCAGLTDAQDPENRTIVEGNVFGRVTEKEPNGDGLPNGLADGEFDIFVNIDVSSLGIPLHTDAREPIRIYCENIDLSRAETTYTCVLDLERLSRDFDRPGDPQDRCQFDEAGNPERCAVVLYGSQAQLSITDMEITFTGVPTYGPGPQPEPKEDLPDTGFGPEIEESTGGGSTLIIALIAAGAGLVAGGSVLALGRREVG